MSEALTHVLYMVAAELSLTRKGKTPRILGVLSGAEGSRTPDLVIANDALYQLSYGPLSA